MDCSVVPCAELIPQSRRGSAHHTSRDRPTRPGFNFVRATTPRSALAVHFLQAGRVQRLAW